MRIHRLAKATASIAMATIMFVVCSCAESSQAGSAQQSKEFQGQIEKYMEIHKKAVASVPAIPKETTDAALIAKHQQQIADAIRALRPKALVGEVFTPAVRQMILTTVKQTVAGKRGSRRRRRSLGRVTPNLQSRPRQ